MRRLVFVAAAVAAAVPLSLAVNGIATSPLTGGLVRTPQAQALTRFSDCETLRQWYVDQALPLVGPWGLRGGDWPVPLATAELTRSATAAGAPTDSVSSSDTGTTVQEAGVDEPDRAKTDDGLVVHVSGRLLTVTDVSGSAPERLGTLRLPRELEGGEVLLRGSRVLVVGTVFDGRWWGAPTELGGVSVDRIMPGPLGSSTSRLLEISLADPASPRLVSEQTFGGALVTARQYDGTVRLVLSTDSPALDFVTPHRDRTPDEATAENRRIVRESDIDDWLPSVRVDGGDRSPLVACSDVQHPSAGAGLGTLTVVTLPFDDPTARVTTAVTTDGETVYSSTDRLYLATTTQDGRRSEVHAFRLTGTDTAYVASGTLPGRVRDRWSLDERDGHLRAAVGYGKDWNTRENGIVIVREDGDRLEPVGEVRGLGPDEEIQSVRWFDDLALVVTFRQTDPLYTVDLRDPARPRTLGELKIPGFSSYLHPIGEGRILGIGMDADRRGNTRGGQVSLFDVRDVDAPARVATLGLGRTAEPAARWEPRTFTWLAGRGQALMAVTDQWDGTSELVAVEVSDGALRQSDAWPMPRWDATSGRTLPLPDGSVALVTDDVRLLTLR